MSARADLRAKAEDRAAQMLTMLRNLVECESPSQDPHALGRCANLLSELGRELLHRPPQRLTLKGRPHVLWEPVGVPRVLLLGHFDTVWPLGTIDEWPFQVAGGVATGPGVFDTKAGIVIALTAVSLLKDQSGIGILITGDEEIGSESSRSLIARHARSAGAVLICEPSAEGGAMKVARKGVAHYELSITGRAAHAGLEPDLGVNASVELAHQILALGAIANPGEGTTVTPTVAIAGTTSNTVPESATVQLDVRAWSQAEMERVDRELNALRPVVPGATVAIAGSAARPPFEEELSAPLLPFAQAAAADIGLPEPGQVRSGGASDGNITASLGVPTLDGLGAVGAHPHGRDEWADVASMPARAAFLACLIDRTRRASMRGAHRRP